MSFSLNAGRVETTQAEACATKCYNVVGEFDASDFGEEAVLALPSGGAAAFAAANPIARKCASA